MRGIEPRAAVISMETGMKDSNVSHYTTSDLLQYLDLRLINAQCMTFFESDYMLPCNYVG